MNWCPLLVLIALASFSVLHAQDTDHDGPPLPSFGTTVVVPGGLHGTVYLIPNDTAVLPDFEHDGLQRVGDIWASELAVAPRHWREGFPGLTHRFEWFAIDYGGNFWVDQPGRYVFALVSDDGSRLFIDDVPVIDNDRQHSPEIRLTAVQLQGGGHRVRITYFQGPRDCLALVLAVAGQDGAWHLFSTADFKPPSNPEEWHFPASNLVTLVPVRSQEAAITIAKLFKQLEEADRKPKFTLSTKSSRGCWY